MRPLISVQILSLFLIKVSNLFNQLEIPNNIWTLRHRGVGKDISFTRGHAYTINLRFWDSNNRVHIFASVELNFVVFDDNKIGSLWTPADIFVTLQGPFNNIVASISLLRVIEPFEVDILSKLE